jgi:probable phosphoglycerate mutase
VTRVAFLRHGPTDWNLAGRLQGRTDLPLSAEAHRTLPGLRLPEALAGAVWHASPLARARETARLLGAAEVRVDARLIEMDFGRYEGQTLAELRRAHGAEMARNEARGLDFLPPDGESPRQVQARIRPWLRELAAAAGGLHVAVSHKGVLRAIMALAWDWDMLRKPPVRVDWSALQIFGLDEDGAPWPEFFNLPLEPR